MANSQLSDKVILKPVEENDLARNRATYAWDQTALHNKGENHAETLGPAVQVLGLRLEQVQGAAGESIAWAGFRPGPAWTCRGQTEGYQDFVLSSCAVTTTIKV